MQMPIFVVFSPRRSDVAKEPVRVSKAYSPTANAVPIRVSSMPELESEKADGVRPDTPTVKSTAQAATNANRNGEAPIRPLAKTNSCDVMLKSFLIVKKNVGIIPPLLQNCQLCNCPVASFLISIMLVNHATTRQATIPSAP